MKKYLAILLALSLFALCACTSKTADTPAASSAEPSAAQTTTEPDTSAEQPETDAAPEENADAAGAVRRVEPLDEQLDVSQLTDAMMAASFDADGIEEKEGKMYLTFDVYDYDRYDMVDVSQLAEGDIFVAGGKDLTVKSKTEENGCVLINGGLEQGGVTLTTNDDGVYYELGVDDVKCYRALGTVTMELSDTCAITDSSDSEKPDLSVEPSQLSKLASDAIGFRAANTTITMAGGKVVAIARSFLP